MKKLIVLLAVMGLLTASRVSFSSKQHYTEPGPFLAIQADPSPLIKNYTIPTPNSVPNAIIVGPDNHTFWFTEFGAGNIGEFNSQTHTFSAPYSIPENGAMPATIALDNNGLLWFTDENQNSPSVWSLNSTTGRFQAHPTHSSPSDPIFVLVDPSTNNVWFTDYYGNYIGEITNPNHVMIKHPLPSANSYPVEIAKQSNTTYLWITEATGKIARFDTLTNQVQEFTPNVPINYPVGIVVAKNGDVWVSEHGGSSVTEFVPANSTWKKYPTSQATIGPGTGVATLAIDGEGRLWFAEHYANRIGRLDPATGQMEEFSLPIPGAYSLLNTVDSSGNFWFTEASANQIGMIPASASALVIARPIATPIGSLSSGSSASAEFTVMNENQTSSVMLILNVTSSFTPNYYTSKSEVSLSSYFLSLGPGKSQNVSAVVTPDFSLASGTYAAGVVATYGNVSSIGTFFFRVTASPLYQLETLLPETLIVASAVLLLVFLSFRRRRVRLSVKKASLSKATSSAFLLTVLLFVIDGIRSVSGKCPGLPTLPGGGGPDPYGIALDIGSIAFFAVVAYLLIRDRLHGQ